MEFKIGIPMELANIQPETNIQVVDTGRYIVFGGLVAESEDECKYQEKQFWEKGCSNGKIVKKGAVTHAFSVPVGTTKEWWPDDDAMDNIDCQALAAMGVGEIKWFGACGSKTDPLHAGYRLKDGEWVVGDRNWSWRDAIKQLMDATAVSEDDPAYNAARRQAATAYGEAVLAEVRKIRRGEVYGVVVYAVLKNTTRRAMEYDFEVWGHIGKEYAAQALAEAMDDVVSRVPATR